MFSKKTIAIIFGIIFIAINIIGLAISFRSRIVYYRFSNVAISIISPLQELFTHSFFFLHDAIRHYFVLISVEKENEQLKKYFNKELEKNNKCIEISLDNIRLRNLLNLKQAIQYNSLAAEVIGKDPSNWFKTIIINKGEIDGVRKNLTVIVSEGIVGQIIDTSKHYSKVMLIIDQHSAIDAIVQRNRARGIIKGESNSLCSLNYVLRKHEIKQDDIIISSGSDRVFPKGFRIGYIDKVMKLKSGIFQEIVVIPFVDFENIEEVLVVLDTFPKEFEKK